MKANNIADPSAVLPPDPSGPPSEDWLETFESQWQTATPPNVIQYLSHCRPFDCELARCVIEVDLEYRWRAFHEDADRKQLDQHGFPVFPTLDDYIQRLPAEQSEELFSAELIAEEFRARRVWGDRPSFQVYIDRFPDKVGILSSLEAVESELCNDNLLPELAETQVDSTATEDQPNKPPSIDRYQILEEIGGGNMGVVYSVRDPNIDKVRAVKVIGRREFATQQEIDYFERECRALAQVEHPHVVRLYDAQFKAHLSYLVMEYVRGGNLKDRISEFRKDIRTAVELVAKIADAVACIHECNPPIVHRDLKPANVLINEQGNPKVGDFGLAKFTDEKMTRSVSSAEVGTPAYMAPEQTKRVDGQVGPESDVWALGVIVYELLTGSRPFTSETDALYREICHSEPQPPSKLNPQIDRRLEAVIFKCLEKKQDDRFATARPLAEELQRWLNDEPMETQPDGAVRRFRRSARRHPWRASICTVVVVASLVVAIAYPRLHPDGALWRIEKQLKLGHPVTLIAETGPPSWKDEPIDTPIAFSQSDDGEFTVETAYDLALIELIRAPQLEHYSVSAEIRHEEGRRVGEVGLYIGHSSHFDGTNRTHCFCRLSFNDLYMLRKPPPFAIPVYLKSSPTNPIEFGPLVYSSRSGESHLIDIGGAGKPRHFQPGLKGKTSWRSLKLEVSSTHLIAYFDGEEAYSMSKARVKELLQRHVSDDALSSQDYADLRGPLGIFLSRGRAAIRNVVVSPVPEHSNLKD